MNNLLFVVLALVSLAVSAQSVYKSVDAQGRTEYTQVPAAGNTKVVNLGNVAPAQETITEQGCVSYQCYADQLERERLVRERAYAKRDAEQARIEAQAKQKAAAQAAQNHRETCQRFPRASECLGEDAARKRTRVQRPGKNR